MSFVSKLDLYRRMLASSIDGEEVVWWYFGTTFVRLPDGTEIPVMQAETIMAYRTETLDADSFRIHWREVGYFRDPITGEAARHWLNPVTGHAMKAPSTFEEGPSHYTVSRQGDGLTVTLEQAHAIVERIETRIDEHGSQRVIVQTERKRRGFPLPDGTMPVQTSGNVTAAETVLTFFAQSHDTDSACSNIPCSGIYSFGLNKIPAWMGMPDAGGDVVVKGMIHKASTADRVNVAAWQQLQGFFPEFFRDGRVAPAWN